MEIPNLPTDKFYKFITVSGLVMIFTSMTYLFIIQESAKITEELVLAAGHDVRAHYLKKKIAHILQRNSAIELKDDTIGIELKEVDNANFFARSLSDEPKVIFYRAYDSKIDSLESKLLEINDIAEKLAIEEVSFLVKDIYFINKGKDKQLAQILLTSCCIIGVLMCFWGFKMWYRIEVKKNRSK